MFHKTHYASAALGLSVCPLLACQPANQTPPVQTESVKPDVLQEYWPNGRLKLRREVLKQPDGALVDHGAYKCWHDNGQVEYFAAFDRGRKQGTTIRWHKNGRKWQEQQYLDGERHGTASVWDENGVLRKEERHAHGKPHGVWKTWDAKGNLKWQAEFEAGVPMPRQPPSTTEPTQAQPQTQN